MDIIIVLKQAWRNVVSYRALWIFGLILALTTVSTTNAFLSDRFRGPDRVGEGILGTGVALDLQPGESFLEALGDALDEAGNEIARDLAEADRELSRFYREVLGIRMRSNILTFLTVLAWVVVLFFVLGRVLRYISETALIKMVDDQEETGEQRNTRYGFRVGWSRISWRLFLIDLVIDIPAVVVFLVLFVLVFTPLFLWELGITELGLIGVVLTSGLFFLFIFLAIIFAQVLGVLKHFMRRACALDGLGVLDSVRRGYNLVRQNLKDAGLVWLVLAGVNIGWPIVMGVVAVLLLAVSTVVGGGAGLLSGLTANLFGVSQPVVVGLLVGAPLFMLILILPLLLLEGLREVFHSSTWTLVFRELRGMESLEEIPLPELPDLDEAGSAVTT